ncbi:hypothetical protein CBOM_02233 [Ceraceosorus bombacis]|uniref:Uncharacterized protein n=1 Tax=Ceraceosorus bombacis TaxID=401625 RepID=A0A0P1BDX0_9BASI|nr:hypothetical protein CBOM_02233 [Ceraceosorus bombacis]
MVEADKKAPETHNQNAERQCSVRAVGSTRFAGIRACLSVQSIVTYPPTLVHPPLLHAQVIVSILSAVLKPALSNSFFS